MNPITQILNRGKSLQTTQVNDNINKFNFLKDLLSGKNSNDVYNQLMNSNPTFRNFVDMNKGKTPEQIADQYGVNLNSFLKMINNQI